MACVTFSTTALEIQLAYSKDSAESNECPEQRCAGPTNEFLLPVFFQDSNPSENLRSNLAGHLTEQKQ